MICKSARSYFQTPWSQIILIFFFGSIASAATTTLDKMADDLEAAAQASSKPAHQQAQAVVKPGGHPAVRIDNTQAQPIRLRISTTLAKPPTQSKASAPGTKKSIQTNNPQLPTFKTTSDSIIQEMNSALEPKWMALKKCLTDLKEDSRYRASEESAGFLDEYVTKNQLLMTNIEKNKSDKASSEKRRLQYANWMTARMYSECLDLSNGPDKSRYVYLIGQQAKNDGKVFETIVGTMASERIQSLCVGGNLTCWNQIVIKYQAQKDDLLLYLKLIAPGSLKYLAYVGHGWSYGFLLGFKDMSVPADWHSYSKLTNLGWQAQRQGAIYSDDMNYVGPIIAKALDPNGEVAIFACNNADDLAPILSGQLPVTTKVLASESGMEYKAVPGTAGWSLTLPTGEKFNGPKIHMYPSTKNAFKKVPSMAFKFSQDFAALEKDPEAKETGSGYDDMASAVLTRVGRKEAWFDWVNSRNDAQNPSLARLIVFDNQDRETIAAIFKIPAPGHGLFEDDLEITFSEYDERVKQVLNNKEGEERNYLLDLFERINACIEDGVSKFY